MEEETKFKIKVRSSEEKKAIINRVNRIIGQMNGIKNMVESDRYCNDVLIQLAAIDKSIKGLANFVLDSHMHTCMVEHIKEGELGVIDEIVDFFKMFQ